MDDSFAIKRRPNYLKIFAATLTVLTLGFGGGAVIASQMDDGSSGDGEIAQTTSKSNRAELASQTGILGSTNLNEDGVNADASADNQTYTQNGASTVNVSPTTTTSTSTNKTPSSTNSSASPAPAQTQTAPTPAQQNPTPPTDNSTSSTADADAALRACLSTGNILSPLLALEICAGGGSGLSL